MFHALKMYFEFFWDNKMFSKLTKFWPESKNAKWCKTKENQLAAYCKRLTTNKIET